MSEQSRAAHAAMRAARMLLVGYKAMADAIDLSIFNPKRKK
jgi:hypothetical protein